MSIICQDVAILTTTTVRTILTVYVSTVLSQAVGRPTPLTSVIVGSSCSAYTSASLTTERCSTSSSTATMFMSAASPSQVQVPLTITSQIYQTQFNTLLGTSCRTVPVPVTPPTPQPTTPATPQPTTPTPPQPTTPTTQPTPQQPGLTDTTFTTEYVTVTGSRPPDSSPTTTLTSGPSTSSRSRSTVYGLPSGDLPSDADPSSTALAQGSSGSSRVPIAAIAGGAAGGVALIVLLGLLAYFLIIKKSPKGYERPVEDYVNDQYHEGTNSQSGLYPQMQEQAGYHTHDDGLGYSQQYQGNTGSQSLQYSDHLPADPQNQYAQGLYTDSQAPQYWQQNVSAGAAVAALPPGAAAAVVVGHRSSSSTASPTSYTSTAPLLNQAHHHQQHSQSSFLVPYRGYAEPVDDGRI